jgi:hypothetical protein
MSERHGPWFLITGILIGVIIGLAYSLFINPVKYTNAAPHYLDAESKNQYRVLVALAYAENEDKGRANARLALLREENPERSLAMLAQQILAFGGSPDQARALAKLSVDLGGMTEDFQIDQPEQEGSPSSGQTVDPATPTITGSGTPASSEQSIRLSTPFATFTPPVQAVVLPGINDNFLLSDQEELCKSNEDSGLLMIDIVDEKGNPIPGVRIDIRWDEGEDTFFTGLYPDENPGFANFEMQQGVIYNLQVGGSDDIIRNLSIPACQKGGVSNSPGGLWLKFSQG